MTQKDTGSAGYYSEYLGPVEDKPIGMSLRDCFAGQILPSVCDGNQDVMPPKGETWAEMCAREAYQIADAMIEARKETE